VNPPRNEQVSVWTGLRNFLYGLQWWFFGGFAVFIWWRWCRDQLAPRVEEAPAEREEPVTPRR